MLTFNDILIGEGNCPIVDDEELDAMINQNIEEIVEYNEILLYEE